MRLAFAPSLKLLLLTLAVTTVPAEITPTRMLELPVAFGADADHVGHDGADGRLLIGDCGLRIVFA